MQGEMLRLGAPGTPTLMHGEMLRFGVVGRTPITGLRLRRMGSGGRRLRIGSGGIRLKWMTGLGAGAAGPVVTSALAAGARQMTPAPAVTRAMVSFVGRMC